MAGWKRVVAGFDDSDSSTRALQWAGAEARERGAELVVVQAWAPPTLTAPVYAPQLAGSDPFSIPEGTREALHQGVREALGDSTPETVNVVLAEGSAAKVLTDFVDSDDVLVVGSRGRGGFAGLLLGSVSQHVVTHAQCTVVVVR